MGSKYPRSLRFCLPLWAFVLQVAFILFFGFFISYDDPSRDDRFMELYQVLQDLTLVAALGFGFLSSSLRRHSWSSVGFNLFMLALGVQGTILLNHFLGGYFQLNDSTNLLSIRRATVSTVPALISAGAVLGMVNLLQLSAMVLLEAMAFGAFRIANEQIFEMSMKEHTIVMYGHVFGAYFGLLVAWCLSRSLPKGMQEKAQTEKVQMSTGSSLFAMLGTLFLWIFWPSFNCAFLDETNEKKVAVFNTYYALAVSTVTATSASALTHPQGKINMIHIHNAVLAGGVAVGAPCFLISSPWIAMVLGLTAGLISIGGAKCQIQNFSGTHYTFGLPGLLGGATYFLLRGKHNGYFELRLGYHIVHDFGPLCFAVALGMVSGLLTGWVLIAKMWRGPHTAKYFDDQTFWEFPHLAVGF